MRYSFLGDMARTVDASAVAVGHTLDDRAETVMMHIIRGSGTEGLAAMPARSPWPFGKGPDIVRPLLELRREDTLRYCRESGIEPRIDSTNHLPVTTRNRVRAELMPLLRTYNPRIDEALARLAESLASDAHALSALADLEWERANRCDHGSVKFDRVGFARLPEGIGVRLIQRAARELQGESPSAKQMGAVLTAASAPPAKVDLPGGLLAMVDRRWLIIRRNPTES
jgi:tRNA(Ile)-lysidine synthase